MAIIWQNRFDGISGNITAVTSGLQGDPISVVQAPATFQTVFRAHGAGAGYLGNTSSWGQIGIPLDIPASGPYALRLYFYLPANGVLFAGTSATEISGLSLLRLAGTDAAGPGSTFSSVISGQNISLAQIADMQGKWVRYEVRRTGVGGSGQGVVRLWWTDPEATGEGSWDLEIIGSGVGPAIPTLYLRGRYIQPGSEALNGAYVDSVMVSDDGTQFIGPYEPGEELILHNTLNGADGTTITTANTGEHGNPATSVTQSPQYSSDWAAEGTSSARLVGANTATALIWSGAGIPGGSRSQWSLRFYFLVPAGGHLVFNSSAAPQFFVSPQNSSFTWSGGSMSSISANLVDQPVRVEFNVVDYVGTMRIWWTDVHSEGPPDYEDTSSSSNWAAITALQFVGGASGTPGSYIDALEYRQGGWIGPARVSAEGHADVAYTATAVGTADIAGTVSTGAVFSAEVEGSKTGTSAAVESVVLYGAEVEHDARELGLAIQTVEYSGEVEAQAVRDTDASADVEYSGEIEWLTEREGEGDINVVYLPEASGESRITLPDVTRVGLRYRLVAYDPNGARRGQLPLPLSFQMGVPLNDLPSLALEYLQSAPGASLLNNHCEVAVEIATLTSPAFGEYPGCRFINLRNQTDPSDRTGNVKYTMPHYGWQLRKARVLTGLNEEGQRSFASATFGQIMHTLLTEAQSRGWNPGMSWDFTPQRDSAGQVWDQVYTVAFDAGQDLWTILETFAQQAACDFRFVRRVLQVYNADTALNRNQTNQAVLHLGRDITSAPNDWTSEELASRVLVRGDEGSSVMITVNDAVRPWGFWENYVNQSGVTDTGTLTTLARWTLDKARQPLVQMTRGILFPTAQYMPFRDYLPGDYITAPGNPEQPWATNQQEELRVRQITLVSVDGQGMEGALVLNERFVEASLRRDRLLNALTGGAGSNPGGGGGGTPPREDTRTPRAPTGLVVGSETYINEIGEPRGQITATWQLVTEATNGTPMDIRSYEVWVRWAARNQPWQLWTTVDNPTNQAFMSPFNPDEVYEVRVRAVGRNVRPSAFSTTVPILVEGDAIPPEIPAAPLLESRLGVVRATWNGLDFQGTPMAPDFDYVAVWMSETASLEDGWERIDTLYRTGVSVIPDLPYDTEFYFRFTAIDRSGNESEPSSIASISVQQLVSGDISPGSIGYELLAEGAVRDDILADDAVRNRHIAAGEITGEKVRAYSIFADRIAVGNTRNLLTDPKHLDGELNDLRLELADGNWTYVEDVANAQNAPTLSRSNNPNGTYRYYWVQSIESTSLNDLNAGYRVQAELGNAVSSTLVTLTGRTAGVVAVTGFVRLLDREGNLIGQPGTTSEFSLNSNITNYELISNNGATIPPAAVSAVFYVRVVLTGLNAEASVSFAKPFSALNDGQVLIENGAITANKIAANSITADKIVAGSITAVAIAADAITTDKLAANAITAKHTITGAIIQTTASANRGLKISSGGMTGFDSLGNQTFAYSSATGAVRITGRFQTGVSTGNNVVIDSGLYAGRPAIQLNTGDSAQLQPVMYSMGAGSSEYDPGSLLIHGRETFTNNTGRNTLQLKSGTGLGAGGASLMREYSTYGGVGFAYENWAITVNGRKAGGVGRLNYIAWGRTDSAGPGNWGITYGQAAPNGGRLVMASANRNTVSPEGGATVKSQGTASFTANTWNNSGSSGNLRLQYYVMWVDSSVSGG